MRRDVAVALALPVAVAAGSLLTYGAVGEISEDGGHDVMWSLPQGRALPLALGGLALAALVGHLAVRWRPADLPREAWSLLALWTSLGVATGFGLRVVSGRTNGANIGGGMLLLASPIAAAVALALTLRWWRAIPSG